VVFFQDLMKIKCLDNKMALFRLLVPGTNCNTNLSALDPGTFIFLYCTSHIQTTRRLVDIDIAKLFLEMFLDILDCVLRRVLVH
jgi:hypothetical protein